LASSSSVTGSPSHRLFYIKDSPICDANKQEVVRNFTGVVLQDRNNKWEDFYFCACGTATEHRKWCAVCATPRPIVAAGISHDQWIKAPIIKKPDGQQ
jgi:hypothetical protein